MNTDKAVSRRKNGSDSRPQDQQHLERKSSDADAELDEGSNQQDASRPRRMSRETAEHIPADHDPDDPVSI